MSLATFFASDKKNIKCTGEFQGIFNNELHALVVYGFISKTKAARILQRAGGSYEPPPYTAYDFNTAYSIAKSHYQDKTFQYYDSFTWRESAKKSFWGLDRTDELIEREMKRRQSVWVFQNKHKFIAMSYYGFVTQQSVQAILDESAKFTSHKTPFYAPEVMELNFKPEYSLQDTAKLFQQCISDQERLSGLKLEYCTKPQDLESFQEVQRAALAHKLALEALQVKSHYQDLVYYGFLQGSQACKLFREYYIAAGVAKMNLSFPAYLSHSYEPSQSFEQAQRFALRCCQDKRVHWTSNLRARSYWSLPQVQRLKEAYERNIGVGECHQILFTQGGIFYDDEVSATVHSMSKKDYTEAKDAVLAKIWEARSLWIDMIGNIVEPSSWIVNLLTEAGYSYVNNSYLSSESDLSIEREIDKVNQLIASKSYHKLEGLRLIEATRALVAIDTHNHAILNGALAKGMSTAKYRKTEHHLQHQLQSHLMKLDNFFVRPGHP